MQAGTADIAGTALWQTVGRTFWLRTLGYTVGFLVLLGLPTVLIPNPLFSRMIAPTWWSYPMWIATALLAATILAARRLPGAACSIERPTVAGGGLAFLAIACPTCNLLVMTTLGASGALSLFAPVQPFLGVAGILLLVTTLVRILRMRSS